MLDFDYEPEEHGYIHTDDLPNMNNLRDHVQGVLDALYGSGDINLLESCLDEVCSELDIELKLGSPVLQKKPDLMYWYIGYQNDRMNTQRITP